MFIITGIILPFILYLITLPLQSFLFILRKALKVEENRLRKRLEGSSKSKFIFSGLNINLKDRITGTKSDNSSRDIKALGIKIKSLKALQVLIASISFLIGFLRSVAHTIICLMITLVVTVLPITLLLIASVAGYFFLESDGLDGITGGIISGNVVEEVPDSNGSSGVAKSVEDWLKKCEEMANFYINSIATYDQSLYLSCDLLEGKKVRADCTGYMYATLVYAGLIADNPSNAPSSHTYVVGGSDGDVMVGKLQEAGFEMIKAGKGFEWKDGDIAAVNGHVELVVSVKDGMVTSWGWGSVKTYYPNKNAKSLSEFASYSNGYYAYCYRLK